MVNDKTLVAEVITSGERADVTQALSLIKQARRRTRLARVIADKAYHADGLITWLTEQGIEAVIPPRRHRKTARSFSREAYRERNVVERFYTHAKQFRRLATRFDQTATSYRAGILLVSARYLAF